MERALFVSSAKAAKIAHTLSFVMQGAWPEVVRSRGEILGYAVRYKEGGHWQYLLEKDVQRLTGG